MQNTVTLRRPGEVNLLALPNCNHVDWDNILRPNKSQKNSEKMY